MTRRPDADVTVVVENVLVDVTEVAYGERRDKFVFHLHAEDLAEAVGKLTVDDSALSAPPKVRPERNEP